MQDAVSTELAADMARLESGIRQLKIQYDMFFAGSIPKQPHELRAEIEKLIRHYSVSPIRKYAPRFHFNALVSRFNSLSELWAKTLRALEEGDRPAPAVADRAGPAERIIARCTVADPKAERDHLRLLYESFLEARKKAGDGTGKLPFDNFVRSLTAQVGKLRDKTGCAKVELRIIMQDRKIAVKARPGH